MASLFITALVANVLADKLTQEENVEFASHDVEAGSFELSRDNEPHDGGSYYINQDDELICASVTPQKYVGKVDDFLEDI
jgi:hypothetical protein